MTLTSFLMMAILFLSPLHNSLNKKEDPVDRLARYHSIVSDVVDVSQDATEDPVFTGKFAKERTAILLLSIAWHESGFDKEVDDGTRRGKLGETCMLQIIPNMVGSQHNYPAEYLLDRKNCIRAALHMIRNSRCSDNINTMLRSYVSGRCDKHPDPRKEANIARAAREEVMGYIQILYRFQLDRFLEVGNAISER